MSAENKSMHIDRLEKTWLVITVVTLVVFAAVIFVTAFAGGIQVPVPYQRVDPNTLMSDPNSPWANPGLREIVPGEKYEAYIVARAWQFLPKEIIVPAGSTVTFYIASIDVQHGFKLQNTNLNAQIVPGHVTKMTVTFTKPPTGAPRPSLIR